MKTRVILDSDAIVGLMFENDALHERSLKTVGLLESLDFDLIIPYPIVLEAATALSRGIGRSDLAKRVLKTYSNNIVDEIKTKEASEKTAALFDAKSSKRNTPFDYYVLSLAKINNVEYVFSFDRFYKRSGLKLLEELLGVQEAAMEA